jgi:hypothetical protein
MSKYFLGHHLEGEETRLDLMSELLDPMHRRCIEALEIVKPGARTITELRNELTSSGKLNDALVDAFLSYCADSNWWTQTIAFTAVHARAPEAESNLGTGAGGCDFASIE